MVVMMMRMLGGEDEGGQDRDVGFQDADDKRAAMEDLRQ